MERLSNAYWIWCEFESKDLKFLLKIKDSILESFKSPNFSLHLTLAGPYQEITSKDIDKIKLICKYSTPFHLELDDFKFKNTFYESLYISVKKSSSLINLRESIINYKTPIINLNFDPHISLIYGIHSESKKIKESQKLVRINKKMIKVNKIAIVDVNEDIDKWEIKERILLQS